MRIGFFGGSFDPPHLGHLVVAQAAAAAYSLDRVLFVPTARQPLKPEGAVAPYNARLHMVQLLCDLQPADTAPPFEPSSLDAPHPDGSPNYTIDTLTRLRSTLHPADEIFAIIGADAFANFASWRSPSVLLQLAQWIVVNRPGATPPALQTNGLTPTQSQHVHPLEDVTDPTSATDIRTLLQTGSDCPNLLPPHILHYIREHHLYNT